MPSALRSPLHLVSQSAPAENSSTEFRPRTGSTWSALAHAARRIHAEAREVAVFTMASHASEGDAAPTPSCVWMTERNESVSARIIPIRNPNGKDRLNSAGAVLLMAANSPEITRFADERRQQSAAADEQVMDRDAERVAGGYDAI